MIAAGLEIEVTVQQPQESCVGCCEPLDPSLGFYEIGFRFESARRLRERHRDKHHKVAYCRRCYEHSDSLVYLFDDEPRFLDPRPPTRPGLKLVKCASCNKPQWN